MNNIKFFRYLAYSIEILILFVLGSTPSLFKEIYGATPCLLVSLAITISVFEPEVPSMVFGFVCGALTDLGFSNSIGTFAIGLTIVCFILGYCANNIITVSFWNVMLATIIIVTALLSIHFLFSYVMAGYADGAVYFVNHYISRIVQTILYTVVFYYLNKFIYTTLNDQ
ncbi:MAG: rod shape-determining protein MreD [Ruminococcus sp.]|nr:rod shape-determining protein MreD [Ruminococcus sp.]